MQFENLKRLKKGKQIESYEKIFLDTRVFFFFFFSKIRDLNDFLNVVTSTPTNSPLPQDYFTSLPIPLVSYVSWCNISSDNVVNSLHLR